MKSVLSLIVFFSLGILPIFGHYENGGLSFLHFFTEIDHLIVFFLLSAGAIFALSRFSWKKSSDKNFFKRG